LAVPHERPGGIKAATIGTTVYLLPREHKRVRRLVLDMDVPSVHELLLLGLDRFLTERGEPPIEIHAAAEEGIEQHLVAAIRAPHTRPRAGYPAFRRLRDTGRSAWTG
jgi:hypothetical protein